MIFQRNNYFKSDRRENEEDNKNEESDEDGSLSDSSLPTHISEISEPEHFDVDQYVKKIRQEYTNFNNPDQEKYNEEEREDSTKFPLYVRLNKLRKMRQDNENRRVLKTARDILYKNNDKFDQFTKKMIHENLIMANPENYEGIYFSSNEDYVKYMKSKHTAKVDTLDIDKLCSKLEATMPRYKRDTDSRLIKTLKVSTDEYKGFEK